MRAALRPALVFTSLLILVGCGASQGGWKRGEKIEEPTLELSEEIVYESPSSPMGAYNDPPLVPPPDTELGNALIEVIAQTAETNGKAAPVADGRLFAVARDVAGLVVGDQPPPYAAVEFALSHHGIIEPSPNLLVAQASDGEVEYIAEELRSRLAEILATGQYARFGVGWAPIGKKRITLVLAFQESFVETEPIPRRAAPGADVPVRGKLLYPFENPRIFVTSPKGSVERVPVARAGTAGFRARVACGQAPGQYQVEIVGDGKAGPSVLANFPVWCGMDPPHKLVVAMPRGDRGPVKDAGEAARRIFEYMNEARGEAGLPPLKWDERIADVSRRHSQEMLDMGYVAHVSPVTGSAADRVLAANVITPVVLENIARAYSPAEAHAGLMNSPGHRANILSPEATHAGIGVALGREVAGRPELYVTQIFIRVPERIDDAVAKKLAHQAVAQKRKAAGQGELARDPDLEKIAQELATGLAAGKDEKRLVARAQDQMEPLGQRFSSVLTVVELVGAFEDIEASAFSDGTMRAYGLGLAQRRDDETGAGAFYVVLLFGRGR